MHEYELLRAEVYDPAGHDVHTPEDINVPAGHDILLLHIRQIKLGQKLTDRVVIPFQVLFEPFVRRVFLLDVKPRQIRLGVFGARLILCRFPWSRLDFCGWFFDDSVDKRQRLHARICQVILLLVLVENGYPVWLCLLNKGTTPLDGCLFALQVSCAPRTGDVRHLVTGVVHDDILVVTEKVRVQKVLDTLHCAVAIWLFLDKDRVCLQSPLQCAKVCFQCLKQTVGVLWWNT